jgi:RNA polymerase sigma-70 factor (ECF subfamily)
VASSSSDEELLASLASGSTGAIGELYDRYATVLYPVALRILRVPADAEDVLHDVFVSLPDRASSYSSARGSVAAWLVIVVRNLSIDRTRRKSRRRELEEENVGAPLADAAPERDLPAETAADFHRAAAALQTLPPQLRSTLEIAFFEGLTYPEIAEREGVPLGTVKSRAARALADPHADD